MIKLICSDIDGTLVPDGTDRINPEIFEVIRELKERGIQFVAASGRQYESIRKLFLPVIEDIICVADGGNVTIEKGEFVSITKMSLSDVEELISDIERIPGATLMAATPRTSYIPKDQLELIELMDKGYHYHITLVDDIKEALKDDIVKISLYDHGGQAEEKAKKFLPKKWFSHPRVKAACAGPVWEDFVSSKGGKGSAIRDIQRGLFVTPEETMVFGDNLNDLDMFACARYSFAVGNARQEVKDAASLVADTNVNDGVLKELKNYLKGSGNFEKM
ncbi:HAD family hydrolase [Acetivibrio ethanolgignens]|uniref:Hydrolase n=1 Tax=Acetivibrio ethanolgignens TaxID=290052 RepID=A0A0V8QC54_9FIRM|nr:HAD family hydrolase [Acetivibrio ethanolgignens]KSV58100.1 hypothetical protein ASU35_03450 [Acetivibrio ethanolgignens]